MSAFSSKVFHTIVLLRIFLVCVESQDFCESYHRNNYSMIVFSHSNDTLLLIVDKHFWRLREKETELVFDRKDFQASNSSEQWVKTNYTFARAVYDSTDTNYRGIALFRDQNRITKDWIDGRLQQHFWFDYYNFHGNYFIYGNDTKETPLRKFHQKRFSFSVPQKSIDCEAIQWFNPTTKQFQRLFNIQKHTSMFNTVQVFDWKVPDSYHFTRLVNIDIQLRNLENFTNDIPMIGSYLTSKEEILYFLRIEDDINYCTLEECKSKEYKVLISCSQKTWTTSVRKIWPFVAITVVSLVVFVIITAIVINCIRERKTHPTTVYKSERFSTVQTLDSKTGQPKNKSENDMSIKLQSISSSSVSENSKTNVKSVSSPKSQKNMKLEKEKPVEKKVSPLKQQKHITPAKEKPKKSPKLKK